MLAEEQRPLTHKDRLALVDLIKHLTARGRPGRKASQIFSRAWLVRQLTEEARRRHRREEKAWRQDRRNNPKPSLKRCAKKVVNHWAIAEFSKITAEHEGEDRAEQIIALKKRISDLTSTVLTELRGRGIAKSRRRIVVT
jgi:hypothetical protein